MRSTTASDHVNSIKTLIGDNNDFDAETNELTSSGMVTNSDCINALNYAVKEYCRRVLATPIQVTAVFDTATGIAKIPFDSIMVQRVTVIQA